MSKCCALLLGLFLVVGCSGAESTVFGTVTLDGEPLDHGKVLYQPVSGTEFAVGSIDSSGEYAVQVDKTGGLPSGTYRVKVDSRAEPVPNPQGGPPMPGKYLVPKKYTRTQQSGLEFDVAPGSNEINLELKSSG